MQKPIFALFLVLCGVVAEEVRLLDLDPNDAQQYIDKQDTTLKYAPKIESNVPAVRFLGNEPHNVLEDIYLANQYHGQDGLGGYLYGYSVPDIAKTERKKAGGDLRGAYNYIAGNGQEIKVEYWDDGNGFHQVDNVPKVLPQQIEDTPEVQAAKDEHARIWREEAERNSKPIANPYANYQPSQHSQYQQLPQTQQVYQQPQQAYQQPQQSYQQQSYQSQQQYPQSQQSPQKQYSQSAQTLVNQYQQQKQNYPNPGQNVQYQHSQSGQQYQGQQSQVVTQYQGQPTNTQPQQQQYYGAQKQDQNQDDGDDGSYKPSPKELEEQGPPRGFFYNFDYPVGIIVQKEGGNVQKRADDLKNVYAENKAIFEQQIHGQRPARSSTGYLYVAH